MKLLEKQFKYKGFDYTQQWRDDKYAIYMQYLNGDFMAYEVIIIRKNKEREQFGKKFEACESYPTDNQWGTNGWTYKTYAECEEKISKLTDKTSKLPLHKSVEARSDENGDNIPVSDKTSL